MLTNLPTPSKIQRCIAIGYFLYGTYLRKINIKISDTYMQMGRITVNHSVNLLPV